jgi:hypothetical protein
MENNLTVRVLVFQEKTNDGQKWWVAQCLEYDLATQAPTIDALNYETQRLFVAHIASAESEGLTPFECLPPAPQWYWKKFQSIETELRAMPVRIAPDRAIRHRVPHPEFRVCA